ncbi:BolA protein [Tistlia consotensis]|uniref:BolA protein n=1 Tax=Tistlia consotensis USBA 355 TaxID=560819 RepID=A0A1Y6C4C7_9PROT|nr:BolA family protein [Tistlia consotensis]SMF33296.1 BolA protein [Tistlia consotensis USBA 355]SNR69657.1 BolA protein [Tistlia consotensis]
MPETAPRAPGQPAGRAGRIERTLREALAPQRLEIADDSHRHAGHAGARPEGETHFRVTIVAERFEGLSRVERQRLVNGLLSAEFESGLHALQLSTRTPAEAGPA